jgi:hypothetical protein
VIDDDADARDALGVCSSVKAIGLLKLKMASKPSNISKSVINSPQ